MKRFESFTPKFNGKGPNGRRLCVWCGTEVPNGRKRWCSDSCVKQMQIQHWPQVWAAEVIKRDKGVCQVCGFDGEKVKRILRLVRHGYCEIGTFRKGTSGDYEAWRQYWLELSRLGFNLHGALIEADHIVPIIEGGQNTLENGRALCVPCHKAETKKLASRRKWSRRETGTLFVMQ